MTTDTDINSIWYQILKVGGKEFLNYAKLITIKNISNFLFTFNNKIPSPKHKLYMIYSFQVIFN